jgi:DNA mismatch endonuclease (patch repair protein)
MRDEPWASSPAARRVMQANRDKDTRPELELRRILHALGLRYRLHVRPIPHVRSTADVVFLSAHVVVEVRGCFWHGCPDHYRAPKTNSEYWAEKVSRNRCRDEETARRLRQAGWILEIVWEHEDMTEAGQRIANIVRQRSRPSRNRTAARPAEAQ